MSSSPQKLITWCHDRPSGLKWVVFQPESNTPPNRGLSPTGKELGEYATYVDARNAHPDARITTDAAEALKYGNL
ncbi:MAG: hypothetical protein AB1489_11550 [Acidobacteriota bacterium]